MTKEEIIESMTNDEAAIVTIGVLDKGEKEFYSYGYKAEELDPKNYYYEIGSISKTFTASLLAKAIDEGMASLDDPIGDYIPELEEYDYISLGKLASHTSGMESFYLDWQVVSLDMVARELRVDNGFSDLTRDELVYLIEKNIPEDKDYPFNYSNFVIGLLTISLEEIYGIDYKTLADNFAQEEFGAKNTFVSLKKGDEFHWTLPNKEASNLDTKNSEAYIFPSNYYWSWSPENPILGAGSMVSNIEDMVSYLEFQIYEPGYVGLSHGMLAGIAIDDPNLDNIGIGMDGVAMAWIRNDEYNINWHNGGTDHFDSYIGLDPEAEVGVVVLSNNRKPWNLPGSAIGTRIIEERR